MYLITDYILSVLVLTGGTLFLSGFMYIVLMNGSNIDERIKQIEKKEQMKEKRRRYVIID